MSTLITRWQQDLDLLEIKSTPLHLVSHPPEALDASTIVARLAELGAVEGWVMETSRVCELREQPIECQGLPLAGEWTRDPDHWVLEHSGGTKWKLHHYELHPAGQARPATHLGYQARHRNVNGGHLGYWCLWQGDEDDAPMLQLALFKGLEN